MDYLYGDSWEKFPIKDNEVWKAGPNIMVCADLMDLDASNLKHVFGRDQIDMLYSDPPWNQGNISTFITKAKLEKKIDYWAFIDHLTKTAKAFRPRFSYLEGGLKQRAQLVEAINKNLSAPPHIYQIRYYNRHKCLLYRASTPDSPSPNLTGLDDTKTPFAAMEFDQPKSALDLCMGRGGTARAAHQLGIPCFGVELNKRRLANLLDFYAQNGLEPRPIGRVCGEKKDQGA